MFDLHVVGAGPAGCFSAISALKQGNNVLVSEEHSRAGLPVNCSGLISKSGLDSLAEFVGYKPAILNSITSAAVHVNGTIFNIRSPSTRAYAIDRSLFDSLCCEQVIAEGGKVEFNSRVGSAADLKASHIIGADGPNSSIAVEFGFPRIEKYVSTFQAEFELPSANPHQVHIYLSRKKFPGFFGWLIPRNEERALVGCGVELPSNSKHSFDTFISTLGLQNAKILNSSAFIIPTSVRRKTGARFANHDVLLAGDAAGQAKATTGGGVFFGCSAARIAGELFREPEKYELEWRKRLGADLALHSHLRSLADVLGDHGLSALFSFAKTARLEDFLSSRGDMDRPTKILARVN